MSQVLFAPENSARTKLVRGSSIHYIPALELKSLLANLDDIRDSPLSAPVLSTWLPAAQISDKDTDDEDSAEEVIDFLNTVEAYLDSLANAKSQYYGFDFRAGVPMQSDRYLWDIEDKPIADDMGRDSISTLATLE